MALPSTSTFLSIADNLVALLPPSPPNLARAVMLFLVVRQYRLNHGESDLITPGKPIHWLHLRNTLREDIDRFARVEDVSAYWQSIAIGDQADPSELDPLMEEGIKVFQPDNLGEPHTMHHPEQTERVVLVAPQYRFFVDEVMQPGLLTEPQLVTLAEQCGFYNSVVDMALAMRGLPVKTARGILRFEKIKNSQ